MSDIYNLWSIINYLNKQKLAPYWANTSSNSLAGKLIREGSKDDKQDFENLLAGGHIHVEIDEQVIYSQLSQRSDAMWSLLLASGYLKVVRTEFSEKTGRLYYDLALTNREVRVMFERMIRDWFARNGDYNDFIKALLIDDIKAMDIYMDRVASETFSYFDTGRDPSRAEPERFYHGFVLGLIAELSDRYVITSNRENGFGRYDVMLEPREQAEDAMILEFKVQDTEDEKELSDTGAGSVGADRRESICGITHSQRDPGGTYTEIWICFSGKAGADRDRYVRKADGGSVCLLSVILYYYCLNDSLFFELDLFSY